MSLLARWLEGPPLGRWRVTWTRAPDDVMDEYAKLENGLARHAQDAYSQKRRADGLYEKLRLLENKVRHAATRDDEPDYVSLANLLRAVPMNPRPTLHEIRKGRVKR